MVVCAICGPIQTTVDGEWATLEKRESTLVQVAMGPVIIARLESEVGGLFIPAAACDDHANAIEVFLQWKTTLCIRIA
ncbi:hypothetical protein BMS3Bbin11_00094 [bacterium BMS3Bbin11]|nr:hypothetical protein BMS3Bbin11_00094 [bacterium BMS3Bbin11]